MREHAGGKGRVERAHLTLQDRLVKELRLHGLGDVEAANAFAPEFMAAYNRRFARVPQSEHDAHRPLQPSDDLARVFGWQETRFVSKSLTLNYERVLYVLDPTDAALAARSQAIGIEERKARPLRAGTPRRALRASLPRPDRDPSNRGKADISTLEKTGHL